jgi:predicted DNA-binding ribbon-helix-helix protein
MNARPRKHSLTLRGHRTSVSLEDEFWMAFRKIALEQSVPINVLAARIDAERGTSAGLATAIRLFVLSHYEERIRELTETGSSES